MAFNFSRKTVRQKVSYHRDVKPKKGLNRILYQTRVYMIDRLSTLIH